MKYIIYTDSEPIYGEQTRRSLSVKVLKLWGYEAGIPVYENYRTCKDYHRAADLIRKLEAE